MSDVKEFKVGDEVFAISPFEDDWRPGVCKILEMDLAQPFSFHVKGGFNQDSFYIDKVFKTETEAWKEWAKNKLKLLNQLNNKLENGRILFTLLKGGITEEELQASYYSRDYWETRVASSETKKGYVDWLVYEILIQLADYPREYYLQPFEKRKQPLFKKGTKILSLDGEYADTEEFGQNTFTGKNVIGEIIDVLPEQENCYSVAFPKGVTVFMDDQELLDKEGYVILGQ